MDMLGQLWAPILVAAGLVFVGSFVSWMLLPFHRKEWDEMGNEDGFFESLKTHGIGPGRYMFPKWDPASCKDPEFMKRWTAGPHGILRIWPAPPSFARNLVLSFLYYVLVGFFVAYLAGSALEPGARYLEVFRVTGVAAIMAYGFGAIPDAIWFQKSCKTLVLALADAVVYGLLTAGAFAWLWPAA